ncbi:MAG: DNA polymerase IV [Candidatus Odinarchaeum yellowstonii]|uniref:DNA polymerase IV n=1 Tax=Odinarchaeota yellowstonii (strain LCB_4) TaxID=1841599 RepID=A0AAF0IBC7_ODILC|nr:MAG: DNA polymerase IV [Candidatus Odinarchaeum yellowstonii]
MRIILHVDLDYFYAQIEERDNPAFKGRPVVVCVYSDRGGGSGAVASANYISRRYNVKAGMPVKTAEKLLKDFNPVFLPARLEYYENVSVEVMEVIKRYGDVFEQASVDEAYLDATRMLKGDFREAAGHAIRLQADVYLKTGLTCSVGVSYNKLLAKIAAGYRKPNGVTVVAPEEGESFLKTLKISKIPGIGVKTMSVLEQMGYRTVSELQTVPVEKLMDVFGRKTGLYIYNAVRGLDDEPVQPRRPALQHGRIKTLREDSRNPDYILSELESVIQELDRDLDSEGLSFKTLSVVYVTADFKTHSKSFSFEHRFNSVSKLRGEILKLIKSFLSENPYSIRRIGLRVSNLVRESGVRQLKLTSF